MLLKKLTIKGLFGHFNHCIHFNQENITIITAPNGYGKTVCLKIIDAIFNRKLTYLCDLQFSHISLQTSGGIINIDKQQNQDLFDEDSIAEKKIVLSHSDFDGIHEYDQNYELTKSKKGPINNIESYVPFIHRVGPREWEDMRTDEIYSLSEVIENFSEYFPDSFPSKNLPDWYINFSNTLNAHFIQDQRLIQRKSNTNRHHRAHRKDYTDTIEKYADELASLIKGSGLDSSRVSQQLDTSFPERLLHPDAGSEILNLEELKTQLKELQDKRNSLSSFDLLVSNPNFPALRLLDEIQPDDLKVLSLYVADTKKKLAAYDQIYKKIQIFSEILNKKRLSFKRVTINSDSGFTFETDQGRPLKLTQLSSGEQHQVVLLYELVFKTQENVLVLIDEPEISLHVAWQKEFLKDLKEIIKIQSMPVVIATHSPQIIDDNWELTVNLEEGERL